MFTFDYRNFKTNKMETKHTQGEWEISKNQNQGVRINVGSDPIKMTTICSLSGSPREEEVNANAKLIAAAPDMLDALIKIKEIGGFSSDGKIGILINNAIKKATK